MDKDGVKTDTQKLLAHLNSKWPGKICPMCSGNNWNVSERAYELREFNQGDLIIGSGSVLPVIPVTCSNCGNTAMVNAIISGAIEKKQDE